MVDRVTGGKALPAEVLEQIIAKTDGVPLFVEELTKTVLESGLLREQNDAYVLVSALTPLAIPSTLQDSPDGSTRSSRAGQGNRADRRRDRARVFVSIAGSHFANRGPALQDALGRLMAAELIHRRGAPPDASYVFKHALVQDTAYESLLKSRRQILHSRIAKILETQFPSLAETEPEILAHHFSRADLAEIPRGFITNARAIARWLGRLPQRRWPISKPRSRK